MLQGIRARSPHISHSVEWKKSHSERKKPADAWTPVEVGIHMADLVAGDLLILAQKHLTRTLLTENADVVHDALIPEGTWIWKDNSPAGACHAFCQ